MTQEQAEELHNANNHMRGTMRDAIVRNPDSPIKFGMITIDKCILRFVVYPEKISAKGNPYNPIQLQYVPDCKYVLKAVPVGN